MGSDVVTLAFSFNPTDFNPRSPHGERRCGRAPCYRNRNFNPRSPHGERPSTSDNKSGVSKISIHAPRMGSDANFPFSCVHSFHFNPRSPHGERQPQFIIDSYIDIFQSTLPAWGATSLPSLFLSTRLISIHAPRMGSDIKHVYRCQRREENFNPRSPHGERRKFPVQLRT